VGGDEDIKECGDKDNHALPKSWGELENQLTCFFNFYHIDKDPEMVVQHWMFINQKEADKC